MFVKLHIDGVHVPVPVCLSVFEFQNNAFVGMTMKRIDFLRVLCHSQDMNACTTEYRKHYMNRFYKRRVKWRFEKRHRHPKSKENQFKIRKIRAIEIHVLEKRVER